MDETAQKHFYEKNPQTWVVVAAFNEAPAIADTLSELSQQFCHLLVVNDGSTDNTADVAERAGAIVLTHLVNLGQGASIQTGLEFACESGAQYVATFDADGQHRVSDLIVMLKALKDENLDIVLGSRFLSAHENMPFRRRILLRAATIFTNFTTGLTLTDAHNGLRVMTANTASKLTIQQNRMAHASEITAKIKRLGLRYKEEAVTISYTEYSLSKGQKISDSFKILYELFSEWLSR
jgi:polyprenyl-phospho-N-acetylgalactosaminyl synthase